MEKNRSTWSVILAVVLAMVLMAGLAVTAFAETDGNLTPSGTMVSDRDELVDVLNGDAQPAEGVNYDVDGNGIVEMADLAAFDGTQEDLLPNGGKDAFSECNFESIFAKTSSAIVRGDSTMSIALDSSVDGYAWLEWIWYDEETGEAIPSSMLDVSGWKELTFDTLWTNGAGTLYITIYNDLWDTYSITVEATEAGWTTNVIDLLDIPEEFKTIVAMEFTWDGEHEVYIDNLQTAIKLQYVNAGFSSSYDNAGAAKAVIPGTPYGELPHLVHTFYTFDGWYLDQRYTQKVTADTIVATEADHTLYAKWSLVDGDNISVNMSNAAQNKYGLTLDGTGYKQIRFRFNVKSVTGNFSMDYADGDSSAFNNPIVTIVDENDNIVHPSKVVAGQWYTAVLFGGTVVTDAGTVTAGEICSTGTLTFAADAKVQIEHLEALSGQFGLQLTTRNQATWSMADLTSYGYSYGYHYVQNASNKWDTRIALVIPGGRYTKLSYDFMITNLQSGKENPWYETGLPLTIRERDTGAEVGGSGTVLTPNVWYTAEITLNKTGSDYLYFYGQSYNGADNNARPTFDMYIANMYYVGDGEMIDNVGDANALTLDKVGTDGTFVTSPVSRDRDYGTLYVVEDSADWSNRALRVTLKDSSKELIQVDFRFLVSKNARGKDVAPTLKASTTLSGTLNEAQYIILDENDVPVTALETGKWYRMFITANGATSFGLVPATTGEVKLQLKDLAAFNSDELATTMTSSNTAAGNLSTILSRFGKMEYAYAGTAENAVNIRLNSDLYKQVCFSFQMKNRSASLAFVGANVSFKDASGNSVGVYDLAVGQWYTATVSNEGNALPKNLTMNIGGRTSLIIKDVAGYQTMEIPAANTPSSIFTGLDADEMMIAGFVGPYDEKYFADWNYDQKIGPLPSMARDDIFKMIADVGINYITDNALVYAGAEKDSAQRLLRMASKYGITYMLKTSDIFSIGVTTTPPADPDEAAKQHSWYQPDYIADYAAVEAELNELTQYESFGGSFLRDEPGSDLFKSIRQARDLVKQYNAANGTALNTFTNLLPGVGSHRWTNGQTPPDGYTINSWKDYINCFEGVTDYDYLMFDMYPFAGGEGVIEGVFIEYASRLATIANNEGKMWMGCVQVGGGDLAYYGKRVANEAETHWDVNVMLALGAKGFNYYTLVSAPYFGGAVDPTDSAYTDHSLLTIRGEKTRYYDWAKDVNNQIKAVDHVLLNAEQIGVIFVGDELTYTGGTGNSNSPYKYEDIADSEHVPLINKTGKYGTLNLKTCKKYSDVKLSNVTGDHVMIGAFNYDGKIALYVVNNDIVADATGDTGIDNIQLTFDGSYSYEIIQDGLTTWQTGAVANLTMELGRGALIVVHEGAVSMDATVIYDLNYETSVPAPAPVVLPLGSTYPELPVLKRDFYTFDGWYLNPEGTGEPVKAGDTLAINGAHVLYAKWTYKEDTSLLQPSYTTETSFTNVSRQYVDGVETIVYTTNGKGTPNEGDYQRRLNFTVADTTKEIVKFRFKFVANNDASGEEVAPKMSYYAGGLRDVDTRGFVIVDENGEPAIDSMEVGKWYTFFGLTSGNSSVSVIPAVAGTTYMDITLHIQDRELLDYEPEINIRDEVHAWYSSTAPYQDNEGNWLIHHRSFTGEHHSNTGWNRRSYMDVNGDYSLVSFEFKYNVATYIASGAEPVDKVGFGYLTGGVYFDMNGNPVAAADLKVGTWYKAICTAPLANGWFISMGDINGGSGNTVNIDMDYRNVVGLAADTNPITITSRDKNNLVTTYLGDGMYNINTLTASAPGTAAWQWAAMVAAPDNTHTHMAVTFRFNAAYAADGVTPIDPSMSIWRGSNAGSGVTAQIYDVETGAMVSSDNGLYKALEIGKWYTVVITNPAGDLQTSYRLTPCYKYSGAAKFSVDIADRQVYTAGAITVTTPDSYPNPYTVYSKADGWHQTVFENGSTYNAWQRRTDFGGVAGAQKVEFEVRINSISGACTAQFGTTESRREFYDLETGEYLGYNNNVTLEIGKWYKVVATNGDHGALMGDSFRCYPGNASTDGNVSFSVRNIVATYPEIESVSFDLNYTGAVNDLEPLDVFVGGTYGTLPAPTREGYTFGGWYTDAACTGNAVTAQSTVTGAATLYAKWTIGEDTSLLQPSYTTETGFTSVSRDFIDGKDTIIYTTNGKGTPNEGDYQRRLNFTVADTSKEIVKFRFKYVVNNNASGEEVAPKMSYFAGGLADINSRGFVIVDENGNPAIDSMEVGKWYTFFGLTSGNSSVSVFPAVAGATYMDITIHIQDRELLDYEPEINVRDEVHAWYSSTVPYQDAEGNWLFHYRSFTGEHHSNTGWNRRTYIDIPEAYTHASFEFRFNTSQQAASGEELADRIEAFYGMSAYYTDLEGNLVAVEDLTVGQWYRVTFAKLSYFIAMSDVGGTVNIDMDIRNVTGYTFAPDYSFEDSYYTKASHGAIDGALAYKCVNGVTGDPTNEVDRRIYLKLANNAGDAISIKVKITACSGTPAMAIANKGSTVLNALIRDEAGNIVNSGEMQKNAWYTITWVADGSESYQLRPYIGSAVNGTFYVKDVTVYEADTNPITITSRDKNNLVTTYLGDGMYNINTLTASAPGTAAWQWAAMVAAPDNTHTNMAVTFRFNAAYAADGVTPIDPSMSIWRGSDANSGVTAQIYDVETGAMVSSDNGLYKALEIGKWYTVVIYNPAGDLQTSYRLTPCYKYSGAAKFSVDIADRQVYTAGAITVTTPDSYPNPYTVYSKADGWHQTVFENGSTYNAWQRRTDFGGVAGAQKVEFEVRINSISGACTALFGTTESRREFYDLETGEYLGYDNNVTLEIGKWYKVVATNGDQGALMGDSFRCYPGNASTDGNVSFSVRNFEVVMPGAAEVTFDLNYTGATNAPAVLETVEGGTYGTLPTPERIGYDFGGWYTDAACSGTAVSASDVIDASHTLYAKWTIVADTSLLQPSYTTETGFTSVSRDFVDGKDTIIYTTNGKGTPDEGDYQRRLNFTVADTTKEIVKFRFKYVANNDASGEEVAPKMSYYAGGLADINSRGFVIVDENGEPAIDSMEVGKWYTFFGLTSGNSSVSVIPAVAGATYMDITIHIQDRELLDYEPEINIRDEAHAWYSSTAPYQDNEGNWLIHYRSFTGEHHSNTGWNRRTYIDIPEAYTHVSFEFRFNTSAYAASGEELADRIEAFYGMNAVYSNMDGDVIAATDMVVGQWYRVTFAKLSYFIAMSDVNGGSGNTVNIDMDYRNVEGYTVAADYSWSIDAGQNAAGVYLSAVDGEAVWVYTTRLHAINASEWSRRMQLNITNNAGDIISMKVKLVSVTDASGNPSSMRKLDLREAPAAFVDENGNPVANADLELGKWYTMSWVGTGAATYNIWTFTGSAHATIHMKDITVTEAMENPFMVPEGNGTLTDAIGYYGSVSPVMLGDEVGYMHYIKPTGDPTSSTNRRVILPTEYNVEKKIYSMKIYFTDCSATPSLEIVRGDGQATYRLGQLITDEQGNVADNLNLELNKWYTVTWITDGSTQYQIRPITGSAANGIYYIKDLTAKDLEGPIANSYYVWNAPIASENGPLYVVHARVTGDGTEIGSRVVTMTVDNTSGQTISMDVLVKVTTGNAKIKVTNSSGTDMNATFFDANGNVVAAADMQVGQWYTASWTSDGSATYNIYSFEGTKANGLYVLKNVKVSDIANPIVGGVVVNGNPYYVTTASVVTNNGVAYKAVANSKNDPTNWIDRRVMLTTEATAGDTVSMKLCITETTGTPAIAINRGDSGAISYTITDAEGNAADGNNLELNQWYTITWVADGSATYQIRPFLGGTVTNSSGDPSGANGTFYVKDITVTPAV